MAGVKGRSGGKPKPTALLKLSGGYRKDRHGGRADELIVDRSMPKCPDWLDGYGREYWDQHASLLHESGRLVAEQGQSFALLCCVPYADFREAEKQLTGLAADDSSVIRIQRARAQALEQFRRGCVCFGLTPSDAAGIRPARQKGTEDPLEKLIRRQAERKIG